LQSPKRIISKIGFGRYWKDTGENMNTELLVGMCESKIISIEDELKRINKDIIENGMSDELALELAKNRISLEYAKQEFDALKAQLDDERNFCKSKQYKDGLKELDALSKQADGQKLSAVKLVDDVLMEIENWETTVRRHKELLKTLRLRTGDLKVSEMGKIGNVYALKELLKSWKRDLKYRESIKIR
jgi:hypothetical protein